MRDWRSGVRRCSWAASECGALSGRTLSPEKYDFKRDEQDGTFDQSADRRSQFSQREADQLIEPDEIACQIPLAYCASSSEQCRDDHERQ